MSINQWGPHHKFLLILLCGLFILQLWSVNQSAELFQSGVTSIRPWILMQLAAGLTWAVLFASGIIKLWRHTQASAFRALMLIAVFFIFSGLRFAIFVRSDYDRQRLPFVILVVSLIVLCTVATIWYRGYGRNNGDNE